ncbi:DUF1641 domain-containing protein [Desulfospira joergensenii]|uniref:DUF1641 domain-containing protein n=1 Tax=Desulfospira joergensenii TaxID=53329 RepID=UPI0003B2E703|nr:DUF1641 domain-containing protein [Desulfospira joergensenii]
MSNEEQILERIEERITRLEEKITPIAESAASIKELKQELTPRVNEAVQALIRELADVEADFQLDDLLHLVKKAMRNMDNFGKSLDMLHNFIDFAINAEPLMKITVPKIIAFMDELEQKNLFKMLNISLDVLKNIFEKYTPEEIEQMARGLEKLGPALGNLTDPKAVTLLENASKLPSQIHMENAEPAGLITLIKAANDPDIRQGLGVALELTRGLAVLKN